jgi:thiamine-phosphate pyrophosphorylase
VKRLGDGPYICLITPGKADPSNFQTEKTAILDTIRSATEDGVNLIQIREKALPSRLLFELVSEGVEAARPAGAVVVVNDRVDVAVAASAGVHLRESSLLPRIVRSRFPKEMVIGVSTHTYSDAKSAAYAGADYIFFGPVFPSPGKGEPVGLAAIRDVCEGLEGFPVLALGGLDESKLGSALAAGASGIAAIRSLNAKESRIAILQRLKSIVPPRELT